MELKGLVTNILEKRSGTSKAGNNWVSQDFVIEIDGGGNYPRHLCFTVFGEDRIREFAINLGENISVEFEINAREWQGRWFNSINAYKVTHLNTQQNVAPTVPDFGPVPPPSISDAPAQNNGSFDSVDSSEDLPF